MRSFLPLIVVLLLVAYVQADPPTQSITIVISDKDGKPVEKAQVLFTNSREGTVVTNEKGEAKLVFAAGTKIPPGTIFIAHPDYPAVTETNIQLKEGMTAKLPAGHSGVGSIMWDSGYDRTIPGFDGKMRIDTIRGRVANSGKPTLDIVGVVMQPIMLEVGKSFVVQDKSKARFKLTINAHLGEEFLITYEKLAEPATQKFPSTMPAATQKSASTIPAATQPNLEKDWEKAMLVNDLGSTLLFVDKRNETVCDDPAGMLVIVHGIAVRETIVAEGKTRRQAFVLLSFTNNTDRKDISFANYHFLVEGAFSKSVAKFGGGGGKPRYLPKDAVAEAVIIGLKDSDAAVDDLKKSVSAIKFSHFAVTSMETTDNKQIQLAP